MMPIWRLSLTVNDEPEDLMVLPPMVDGVADKFILLKTYPVAFPKDTDSYRMMIEAELPAYLHWLHYEWQMPEAIADIRYSVKSFHHPDLLRAINELSPENELLSLIDEYCFTNGRTTWEGRASELESYLVACASDRASHIFQRWSQACATYLSRLAKQYPERISYTRSKMSRTWQIQASVDSAE